MVPSFGSNNIEKKTMANINKNEPNTGPQPDRWYDLSLGSSFKDPSSKFCTLRYEFKPASIDKNQAGTLHKSKDNKITVEFRNNQQGKPNVTFEGSSENYKENDAVLFFDGVSFRLERLHRAVKRLRHVRLPGESVSSAAVAVVGPSAGATADAGGFPQIGKAAKLSFNKGTVPTVPVEVERIDIGDFLCSMTHSLVSDAKPQNEKVVDCLSVQDNASDLSPDKMDDLDEQLDILNDDDDIDVDIANGGSNDVKECHTGININIPHQNDSDDEIADVDASDDEADKGPNAAEALRAQVDAGKKEQSSSSSGSSGSENSGSGSGSGNGSSSSDSENSDDDSVTSI